MKSILVIDTPKDCYDCPCSNEGCYLCQISRRQLEDDFQEKRPSWCPLKELPSNKEMKGDWENVVDVWVDGANYGYNKCLNDISGDN